MTKTYKASQAYKTKATVAWANISRDSPPAIWHLAWVRSNLPRPDLRAIRVRIIPLVRKRRRAPEAER